MAGYLHVARLFLDWHAGDGDLDLDRLNPAGVIDFVLAQTRNRRVGSAKYVVCGLRALLRYLYVDGRIDLELAAVVPKVAGWRLAGLPTGLASRGDRASPGELRSAHDLWTEGFAVLTLLARLGLRAGEVAAGAAATSTGDAARWPSRQGQSRGAIADPRRRG